MDSTSVERLANTDVAVQAPPAKAHTLRALIIASLADGESLIRGPLLAGDQLNVIRCLRGLGVEVTEEPGALRVAGRGGRYSPAAAELNVGESGVGMNFLSSAACLSDRPVVLTGAKRITERPVGEVVGGLRQLGCQVEFLDREGFPPVRLAGGGIRGGTCRMRGSVTSQYFSSIVISAPCAEEDVLLRCTDAMSERPYFDISVRMMSDFGIDVERDGYREARIRAGRSYRPCSLRIEGDYSSASFFFLAAAICGSRVTVGNLREDTAQGDRGFLEVLAEMGCSVERAGDGVRVEGTRLRALERDMGDMPDLVPPAAIAAAFAAGDSRFTNIGQLRVKECDRLAVMVSELAKMGVSAECDDDSLLVRGGGQARGATIDPHNDHRIAMSFAVAGLVTGDQTILEPGCVAKSFPDFWERFGAFAAK